VDHENLHTPELLKEFHSQSTTAGWPNA
jgi:hypothetical protein